MNSSELLDALRDEGYDYDSFTSLPLEAQEEAELLSDEGLREYEIADELIQMGLL